MLKLKLQYFGHLMLRTDTLEKTRMLGKVEGGRRWGQQRMRWLDGFVVVVFLFWKGVLFLSYTYMFAFTYVFWILCFYSQISDGRVLVFCFFFLMITVFHLCVGVNHSYSKSFLRSLPHPGEKVWWLKASWT